MKIEKRHSSSNPPIALAIFFFLFFPNLSYAEADEYETISIINLIATPERYHQKKITVGGYIRFHLEDQSLCLMEFPTSMKDCIWISISEDSPANEEERKKQHETYSLWESYEGHLGAISGTFDMDNKGHFDGRSGAIHDITKASISKRKYSDRIKNQN